MLTAAAAPGRLPLVLRPPALWHSAPITRVGSIVARVGASAAATGPVAAAAAALAVPPGSGAAGILSAIEAASSARCAEKGASAAETACCCCPIEAAWHMLHTSASRCCWWSLSHPSTAATTGCASNCCKPCTQSAVLQYSGSCLSGQCCSCCWKETSSCGFVRNCSTCSADIPAAPPASAVAAAPSDGESTCARSHSTASP